MMPSGKTSTVVAGSLKSGLSFLNWNNGNFLRNKIILAILTIPLTEINSYFYTLNT
jgi:hypothetical protein